jgi:hypothetical protein
VFDLTHVRNLKKTYFFVFYRFFNFLYFRRVGIVRTLCSCRVKCCMNAISSFQRCFVSYDQCDRDSQIPFGVSLKECFSNFLRDFFFFADFVGRSNDWLNTVAHMIRLTSLSHLILIYMCLIQNENNILPPAIIR